MGTTGGRPEPAGFRNHRGQSLPAPSSFPSSHQTEGLRLRYAASPKASSPQIAAYVDGSGIAE